VRKIIVRSVLAIVGIVLLAAASGWLYLRSSIPDYTAEGAIPGLEANVEVGRDSLGIPHIWARNETDLARATGWVHAQDRLWQMELFRRVADGRLAENLGPGLVDTDQFLRTVGMGRAADATERIVDPESRRILEAYAAGVNAWMDANRNHLPPEFTILRFAPEPWRVRNTLSISKVMAWDLADWIVGLQQQRALDRIGPELAKALRPTYPDWGVTILGADALWKGKGERRERGITSAITPSNPQRSTYPLDLPRPHSAPARRATHRIDVDRPRIELLGDRRRAHRIRKADSRERHASVAPRAIGLVSRRAARWKHRRRRHDHPRRAARGCRPLAACRLGLHQRDGR
jgi:penicillin G amidase